MKRKNQYRAANVAWILVEIVSISTLIVRQGLCIGEIGSNNITFDSQTVTRVSPGGFLKNLFERSLSALHKRILHRPSCYSIGVSDRSLLRIITQFSPKESRLFLIEAVEDALKDINATTELLPREQGSLGFSAFDIFESSLCARITPISPDTAYTKTKSLNMKLNKTKGGASLRSTSFIEKVSTRFLDRFGKLPARDDS